MNFGAFAGGFAQGMDQGLARGKTIREMLKEAKLQEQTDKAMAEAERKHAADLNSQITRNGLPEQPKSGPIETAAPEVKAEPETKVEPSKVEIGAVPDVEMEVLKAPTASDDPASAATAAGSLAPAPKPVIAPSASQAPAGASAAKEPLFVVQPGSLATSGMVKAGNIDLNKRPMVKMPDGSTATVRSISIGIDGKEVLIPTVIGDKVVSDDEAFEHFKKTGEHLGIFNSPKEATAYADALHKQQDQAYLPQGAAPAGTPEQRWYPNGMPPDPNAGLTTAEIEKRQFPNGIPDKRRSDPIPDVNVAPDATVDRPQSSIVPTPAPAASQAAPAAAPAPAAAAPAIPQANGVPPRPVAAAPAAAAPAAAMPGVDVKPPVAVEGEFVFNGKGYATREAAYKAAEANSPSIESYYAKELVPLRTKQYIAEGNPEKAMAWQKWGESQDGREYMRTWHKTWVATEIKDWRTAAKGAVKMLNKFENGQTLVGEPEEVTDKAGNITGFNIRIKTDSTGETRSMFIDPQMLVRLGVNGAAPDKAFDLIHAKQEALDKIKLEAQIKRQDRREKVDDQLVVEKYKADRTAESNDQKGRQRLSEITLKDQLGEDNANKYKKATSPGERAAIIDSDLTKNDPTYSRLPPEEQKKRVLTKMKILDEINTDLEGAPSGSPGPSTFKPAPAGPSAEPQLFKKDGVYYRKDGDKMVPVNKAAAPAAAAPAPAAAAPTAGPATGMPAPAPAAAAPKPAAAPAAAPADPVLAQIQQQSDPTIRSSHMEKYKSYQQYTKGLAELSKSFAEAVKAGDDVQKKAIGDSIAKLRTMAERTKAELSGFYRLPE